MDGEIYKKSLKTTNKKEAEKLLFDWKMNYYTKAIQLKQMRTNTDISATKISKVDNTRRKALIITSSLMGAVTVAGFAVPFLSAWNPSEKAKALGASVKFDLSKLEPGAKHSCRMEKNSNICGSSNSKSSRKSSKMNERVTDPVLSEGVARSSNDKFTVLKGVCTHLSCAPKYHPEIEPKAWDEQVVRGFSAHVMGSKFDLAGVYKGVPAPTNLEVPPHKFEGDTLIIGEPT